MPELPEVETVCRGISQQALHKSVAKVIIRNPRLRWPVPSVLPQILSGQSFTAVTRRGKYILLKTEIGHLIIHLGMSGRLRFLAQLGQVECLKHDHIDVLFADGSGLRYHDPRRFGAWLWTDEDWAQHVLLKNLGCEPLSPAFTGAYWFAQIQNKAMTIKGLLMNAQLVVGVGNIYANEALFKAGIHPERPGKTLNRSECQSLVQAVRAVLQAAIVAGGTTLKDYQTLHGDTGDFQQALQVYGRAGQACMVCGVSLLGGILQGRSTVWCPNCQQ